MKVTDLACGWGVVVLALASSGCLRSPEAKSASYIEAGKKLLRDNDAARAILQFQNAAQATPKNPQIYFQLGEAYFAAADFSSALAAFRKALSLDPKHVEARLRIAQMMAVTDNGDLLEDARARLMELLETSSATPEILNTLAFTELKLGNAQYAIQSLERALAQSPAALDSSVMLARTKLAQADVRGAEDVLKKACEANPKSADAHRALGEFYALQKRMSDAEAQFQRALELDAQNAPTLLDLARLQFAQGRKQEAEQGFLRLARFKPYKAIHAAFLFEEGRRDEAVREFEILARENPEDRQARTNLLAAYRASNRTADADTVLSTALRKNPKDADALLRRGEISISTGNYVRAEADLNQVVRLRSAEPEVHYLLAKLYQARGAVLTYRQELSVVLGLNPNLELVRVELAQSMLDNKSGARAAINLLDAAPGAQKGSIPILVQRNWALWMLGDLAEMRKGIDRGLSEARTPDLLIQEGLLRLQAGNPTGARTTLEEALKIDPTDLRALQALSQTYIAQKNAPMALRKVKEYAALRPESASVQDFLGVLLMAAGDRTQARTAFAKAKEADPRLVETDLSLVQLDAAEGRLDDARKRLYAILDTNRPNSTATLWLGVIEQMRGDNKSATALYRKVVDANPENTQASNNLAYLLVENGGQLDEAQKYAEKAVELAPGRPAYLDTLGWILYNKGLYASAIKNLEGATSHQGSVVWKYHLAMAYAKGGDILRSRATLEVALKLNSDLPEAKIAQRVVAESR